jgi:solute carrier family 50 (sugar transporter)
MTSFRDAALSSLSPTIFIILLFSFVKSAIDLKRDRNERGISIIPYLTLLSNCTVWTLYAIMKNDIPVLVANSVGVIVGISCTIVYQLYSMQPAATWNYLVAGCVTGFGILLAIGRKVAEEGTLAMLLSIAIYGAPLVTLNKVFEERSTQSMPFLISLGNFVSSLSWSLYGLIVVHDVKIVVPSIIGLILATIQMSMFVLFGFGPPSRPHS